MKRKFLSMRFLSSDRFFSPSYSEHFAIRISALYHQTYDANNNDNSSNNMNNPNNASAEDSLTWMSSCLRFLSAGFLMCTGSLTGLSSLLRVPLLLPNGKRLTWS